MTSEQSEPVELNWRVGPPTAGVPGSLYDFVRRFLVAHDGTSSRHELLNALQADPRMKGRLEASRGFAALISNMRHSGDVIVSDEDIRITSRAMRRVKLFP